MKFLNKTLLALLLALGTLSTLVLIQADDDDNGTDNGTEETSEIASMDPEANSQAETIESDDIDTSTSEDELSFDETEETSDHESPDTEESILEIEDEIEMPDSTDQDEALETVEAIPTVEYEALEYYDIPTIQNNKVKITTTPSTTSVQTNVVQTQQAVQPILVSAAEQQIHNRFHGKTIDQLLAETKTETDNMKTFSSTLTTTLQDQANASIIPLDFINLLQSISTIVDQAVLEKEQKNTETLTSTLCVATYNDPEKCKQLINADRQHVLAHTQFLLDMITLTKKFKANDYTLNKATYDNTEQAFKNNMAMIETLS